MDGRQTYLRPSGAATWSKCAGYAALNAALGTEYVEDTDNEVREDGTACHWLAAEIWEGRPHATGDLAPNGRELTDEMFAAVAEYHAHIRAWPVHVESILMEEQVACSTVFPGVADGTPDVRAFSDDWYTLYLGDLKFGYRPVEVWRNAQLIVYAWTLISIALSQGRPVREAVLCIYQPRCAHRDGTWREWRVTVDQLRELAAPLAAAAMACYAPNPICTPGPYCGDCGGAHGCVSLQAAAGRGMEVSYDATPLVLDNRQLGYELSKLMVAQKHIENRINGLSTQAESLIRRSQRVPGFEMGRAGTRWRWRAGSEQAVAYLARLFGVSDVFAAPKIKTVAQMRPHVPAEVLSMFAEKPDGELKLRPIDPNEAAKRFGR